MTALPVRSEEIREVATPAYPAGGCKGIREGSLPIRDCNALAPSPNERHGREPHACYPHEVKLEAEDPLSSPADAGGSLGEAHSNDLLRTGQKHLREEAKALECRSSPQFVHAVQ